MNRKLNRSIAILLAAAISGSPMAAFANRTPQEQYVIRITDLEWDIVSNKQGWGDRQESNYTPQSWNLMIASLHSGRALMEQDWQINFDLPILREIYSIFSNGINGLTPVGGITPPPPPTAPTPPTTPNPPAETRQGQVTAPLNFRRGAGIGYGVIRTLPIGQALTILSETNGWLQVRIGTEEGFVSSQWVQITQGTAPTPPTPPVTEPRSGQTTAPLNFRLGAGTNFPIIRTLPTGQALTILSESNGWLQVRVGSEEGFVSADWVQVTTGTAPTPPTPPAAPTPPPTATRSGQTTAPLNFRRGPGTNHGIIRTLPVGQAVTILRETGGWLRIQIGSEEGYASADWIQVVSAPTAPPVTNQRTGQVTAPLNFRRGAGLAYGVIRTLPVGQTVTILSESNDWLQVRVGSEEGFVSADWVRVN